MSDRASGSGPRVNEKDFQSPCRGYAFPLPQQWFPKKYVEPRDLPLVFAFANITLTYLPVVLWLLLGWPEQPKWVAPVAFLANLFFYQERYFLALHYSQHRPMFKSSLAFLNEWPHAVLCFLYGLPPFTYHLHHCVMHHREDNRVGLDLSATEQFQRDRWTHWLQYWLRHALLILFELPLYAFRKGMFLKGVVSFGFGLFYWAVLYNALRYSPWPAFWLLLMPYIVGSALLMFGNWGQHVFVDPLDPRDDYKLTYVCINSRVNQYAFNDGYHVTHHLFPGVHWTELPANFYANRQAFAEHDAFVFDGLDFFEVGFMVLTKQWKKLASHLVHPVTGKRWPEERAISELQRRVRPAVPAKRE